MSHNSQQLGVSAVIPTFNGQRLLAKHLPALLLTLRDKDEVIIVDDNSTDQSWSWLQQLFAKAGARLVNQDSKYGDVLVGSCHLEQKILSVQLLKHDTNQRFAAAANHGVELARQPLILLLNNDVRPSPNLLENLVPHFADPEVFGVGCLEYEGGDHRKLGGKNVLRFSKGLFIHNRAEEFSSGETAWVSGGSGLFSREKWLQLGGFDPEFYPAYWEDIDISFRARQRGWQVLFEAKATVEHHHESTNNDVFGQQKIAEMSWQHGKYFTRKNSNWWQKIMYFLWQPYWNRQWQKRQK